MIFDAATVMVLRDSDESPKGRGQREQSPKGRGQREKGPKVLMVRRNGKSSFMPNAWVYPGGRVDEADADPRVLARILGEPKLWPEGTRADARGLDVPTRAAALYLAAIRETFEEAGVLLARKRGEDDWLDLQSQPRFATYREQLRDGTLSLSVLAEEEDLVFPIDELAFFAHWITPTFEPKRFDTYFFLARAPAAQTPLHDNQETTDSFWSTASAVLERAEQGDVWIAPPTQRTLQRLQAASSVDHAFAIAHEDWPPPCILPHLLKTDSAPEGTDGPVLLLPGDDEYPADNPEYALATPVRSGPTRMLLQKPN